MPKFSGKRKRSQIPHGGTKRVKTHVNTVTKMARMLKGELKSVDTPAFNLLASTTLSAQLLNGTIPGSTSYQRLGRKISMKSVTLFIDLDATAPAAAASNFDHLRLVLLYDKQPNGAPPGWADVFLDVSAAGGTVATSQSHTNLANSERFKIIRDYHYKMGYSSGVLLESRLPDHEHTGHKSKPQITEYIPLGLDTMYNAGVAGTIADITTGSLYLFCLGFNTAANSSMSFQGNARLRYYDI